MPSSGPRGWKRLVDNAVGSPWVVVALVLVGGAARLALATQDLYADELATYWVATAHGFTGVIEVVSTTAEITPPFSFLLTWVATRAGESPEIVRLPALVAGIAMIPLVFALGVRTVGRRAALLAATLTALSPFMIFYSAEARGYGVLMAIVLLSTLSLLRAIEDGRRRWWVAYGAFVCLAMYTHYTGIFVLAVQLAWALAVHPRARRPLLVSTGVAALLFLPWLPSLKGDLDSPTTDVLSAFYPLSAEIVRLNLGHWSVGFPFALPTTSLRDLPGVIPLVMLAVSMGIGVHAVITRRARVDEWASPTGRAGVALMGLLAVATPVGTLLQSAVGTNVFAVRSLAASWPYLALGASALVMAARPPLRAVAAGLAVVAFAVGAVTILTDDFQRPPFEELARFADEHPGAVVINGAAFTPGPLTNFEVEGSGTDAPIFRLNVPEQMESPFTLIEPRPDPPDVARRAAEAADGGPIIVISGVPQPEVVVDMVERFPRGYEPTDVKQIGGLFEVQAVVYERDDGG
jgi:4-amino-4-deoxy-L-arabinose transferase-like glycosyltransferase